MKMMTIMMTMMMMMTVDDIYSHFHSRNHLIVIIKVFAEAEFFRVLSLSFQFLKDFNVSTNSYLKSEVLILTFDLLPSLGRIGPIYYLFMFNLKADVVFAIICLSNDERDLNQSLQGPSSGSAVHCTKQSSRSISLGPWGSWLPPNSANCCHGFALTCNFNLSYSLTNIDRKHDEH